MSAIRPRPPTDPVHHRPAARLTAPSAPWHVRWQTVLAAGELVRRDLLATARIPDADRLLAAYGTTRSTALRRDSELFAILDAARRIRESVDRVVVVADCAERAAIELLLATCCHPLHNELPRDQRGGRPRCTTLGGIPEDDRLQGTIDCLTPRSGDLLLDAWGLVVAGRGTAPATQATATLLRDRLRREVFPVPGAALGRALEGRLALVGTLPDEGVTPAGPAEGTILPLPPGAIGPAAVFSAACLLPASIAGIDVVHLLEGAAAMLRRFREAPPDTNPVLSCAAVALLVGDGACRSGASLPAVAARRRIRPPDSRWEGLIRWHTTLPRPSAVSESGPRPSDDLQTAAWIDCALRTDIEVLAQRRDPFLESGSLPTVVPAVADACGELFPFDCHSADTIVLPRIDEHAIGQLLQMLLLAAEVEYRLAAAPSLAGAVATRSAAVVV